ncbi:MAG: O-antigen ligase family protein [Candidatus Omnitrophica bacterium]|nr:O-antigen ligase family protein [Candidatus Omnitrophota bacterium]
MTLREKILVVCEKMIYWGIILIPFVVSFSSAAVNIFIGFVIVGFLAKRIILRDRSFIKTPVSIPFLLLIAIALVSFINSVNIKSSIQGIEKLLKYGFLFLIMVAEIKDKKHVQRIVVAIIAGLFLASADGFYSLIFGKDLFNGEPPQFVIGLSRIRAAFPHTNIFGGYLTLFLALPISLALYYLKGRKKVLVSIVSAFVLYALIYTFSRSAILGAWVAVLFMALIKKDKIILLLLLLSVILLPILIPRNIANWASKQASVWQIVFDDTRLSIYRTSLNMIQHHPMIGVGVNTYCLNFQKYKVYESEDYTGDTQWYAHNIYLHMAGEIGLTGLLIFIWLLFIVFKYWAYFYRRVNGDEFLKTCSLGITAGLVAFLINGMTETNLYYSKIATFFWFQIGLLLAIIKLKRGDYEKRKN